MDYSFYSFYWLDSLEIRLDHNSTYYHSLSKNSDVKPRISHCDSQNLQYKTHPEFWPSHRRIFKTSLYYKTRLIILETRRYMQKMETMKQSGLWSSLGTHGSLVVIWRLCISSSGEARKFDFLSQIWPWWSRSIAIKTIGILTNVFCTSGPNLVILAWMGDELWC